MLACVQLPRVSPQAEKRERNSALWMEKSMSKYSPFSYLDERDWSLPGPGTE